MTRLPRRKHMGLSVKLDACLDMLGMLGEPVQWDHDPPLGMREQVKDDAGNVIGYIPDENDPRYIRPMLTEAHAVKTNGKAHVKIGADKHEIARAKRLSDAHAMLAEINKDRAAARERKRQEKRKWPKQKFKRGASK